MAKRLFTGFSSFEFIRTFLLRLACLLGMLYTIPHYDENPILIVILIGLCLLFILIIGDDEIIIYNDKILQKTNSLASILFKTKTKTLEIEKIKFAYLEPEVKTDYTEIGFFILIALILPRTTNNNNRTRPIFFELKKGERVHFDTNLEKRKMKRIVEIVNTLTK